MSATLVFGGARSGKSAFAERLARESGREVVYIATSRAGDGEMAARIALHREQRPPEWRTVEEELALAQTLRAECLPGRLVLVDCLTLWLSNLILADADIDQAEAQLCQVINGFTGYIFVVSNEVGLGIVPANALARRFSDAAGRLNQAVAAVADGVVLLTAGLPLTLKATPEPQ